MVSDTLIKAMWICWALGTIGSFVFITYHPWNFLSYIPWLVVIILILFAMV